MKVGVANSLFKKLQYWLVLSFERLRLCLCGIVSIFIAIIIVVAAISTWKEYVCGFHTSARAFAHSAKFGFIVTDQGSG